MKKSLLITSIALILGMTSKAQAPVICPTDIQVTSLFVTLTYSPSIPNSGFIDQVKFHLISGTWKTLSLHSQTSTTITFNNQNANLASTDVVRSIRLFRSGQAVARCTTQQTLPVELTSFEAVRIDDKVRLEWTTASELNNDYFELQGMINGEFITLAFQTGAGTTQETTDYQITVENTNTEFFRLKQTDYDGTVDFSDVITVVLKKEEKPLRVMRVNVLGVETPDGKILLEIYKDKVVRTIVIR